MTTIVSTDGPEDELAQQLSYAGLTFERQFRFVPERQFRADFHLPFAGRLHGPGLLVEVEGGVYRRDVGHTSVKGILRDMTKTNLATLHGYRQLRVTSKQIESGEALTMIEQVIGRAARGSGVMEMDELDQQLSRMEDVFERIRQAAAQGQDAAAWEKQWIELLEEYERMRDMMDPTPSAGGRRAERG